MTNYPPAPDPLETAARYTTVAAVKKAIGIDNDQFDTEILQAVAGLEYLIDAYLDTSFPQDADPDAGTDDALDPPPVEGIPEIVKQAALQGSIKVFRVPQAPFAEAGSDDFIGAVEIPSATRQAFNDVKSMLLGLKRGYPLA